MPKRRTYTSEQRRQRTEAVLRWRAKMKAAGNCVTCGKKRTLKSKWYCERHRLTEGMRALVWKAEHREQRLARLREYAAKRRKKLKAERAAAGNPVRAWRRKKSKQVSKP